jgi:hypothetical protein
MLYSNARLDSIDLICIPWETLINLGDYYDLDARIMPLESATSFEFSPRSWTTIDDKQLAKAMVNLGKLLIAMPNLEELEWEPMVLLNQSPPSTMIRPYSCLPDAHSFTRMRKLSFLTLGGNLRCYGQDLRDICGVPRTSLRHLDIVELQLIDDYFVNLLHNLRRYLRLSTFEFHAVKDQDAGQDKQGCWVVGNMMKATETSLLCRMSDYVTHKTAVAPLLSTLEGGSPDQWLEAVRKEQTVVYERDLL